MKQFFLAISLVLGVAFFSFGQVSEMHEINLSLNQLLDKIDSLISISEFPNAREKIDMANKQVNQFPNVNDTLIAQIHNFTGIIDYFEGNFISAIKNHELSLSVINKISTKTLNDSIFWVAVLNNLGNSLSFLGNRKLALKKLELALSIQKTFDGDEHLSEEARIYDNMGGNYFGIGDLEKAEQYIEKGLNIRKKILPKNDPALAVSYNNLGFIYRETNNNNKAIECLEKSLSIYQSIFPNNENHIIGRSHNNLGVAYDNIHDYAKGLSHKLKGLDILKKTLGEDHFLIGTSYTSIASSYAFLEPDNCETSKHYEQLGFNIIDRKLPKNDLQHIRSKSNLATSYMRCKEYDKALVILNEVKNTISNYLGKNYPDLHNIYNWIGGIYNEKGEFKKGIEFYQEALKITELNYPSYSPNIARCYSNIGSSYGELKIYDKAILENKKALSILDFDINNPNFKNVKSLDVLYTVLQNIVLVCQRKYRFNTTNENLAELSKFSDLCLKNQDYILNNLTENESKELILARGHNVFEAALISQEALKSREGFTLLQRSKSYLIRSVFRQNSYKKYYNIVDSLIQKEVKTNSDISSLEKKRFNEEQKGELKNDSLISEYNNKIFDLKRGQESLLELFKNEYPDYYQLKYDNTVASVEEVQSLIKSDQALIEYFVGDSSIFIFTLTQNEYELTHLKKDFPLEEWVTQVREGIYLPEREQQNQLRKDSLYTTYAEAAYLLHTKLIDTIPISLPERLIIVPDGALGYLSFDALLRTRPKNIRAFKEYDYLVKHHAISYNYSATLYQQILEKQHPKNRKSLLAIAPYFGEDRENLVAYRGTRAYRDTLSPLKYNVPEVEGIQNIMGGDILTQEAANMTDFQERAKDYQIVHLSTHGKANDQVGDYSYLAFTELKDSIENEKLYTKDLYNLELNADMVVLSACETGLGELKRGEGIIGLTRGFTYAGAKSIVTTLWNVDDEGSQLLMQQFYENLKEGKTKDVALQEAKLELLDTPEKLEPFYWAGFIPIGDMAVLELDSSFSWWWGVLILGLLLCFLLLRRRISLIT